MPTLNIGNQSVQVDDSFLSLSPDAQNATVDEIANSLGSQGQAQASGGVAAPTTPQANNADASSVADIAKSGASGFAEGLAGLAGLPASALNLGAEGIDYLTGKNLESYTQPIADKAGISAMQGYLAPYLHAPQTQYGKYAETAGSFVPNLIGGPESFATKLLTRVAAPAAGSELGGPIAQSVGLPSSVGQIAGAALGGAAPGILGRAISPLEASAERAGPLAVFQQEGIPVDAATATGRMGYLHNELGNTLGAGQQATKAQRATAQGFTQAALREAGVDAPLATPDVMDNAFTNIGNQFDTIAARNPAIPIKQPDLFNDIDNVARDYENTTGNKPPPIFDQVKQQITAAMPQGAGQISGEAYQAIQSNIAKLARATTSNPQLKFAYYDLREALHGAVQDGLTNIGNGADAAAWQAARSQYKNLLVIERAVSGTSEAANSGIITPAQLTLADKAIYGKRQYVTGNSPFSDLAHAGNQLMKPLPNSGTAERASSHLIPAAIGATVAHGFGALPGVLTSAALPAIAGRALYSKPVQAYLKNQKGAALRKAPTVRNAARAAIFGGLQNQ